MLAAILFPVFAQAKVAAKKATAISNQKQIGLAFMLYTGDNDDVLPNLTWADRLEGPTVPPPGYLSRLAYAIVRKTSTSRSAPPSR